MGGEIIAEGISLKNKRQSNMDRLLLCENIVADIAVVFSCCMRWSGKHTGWSLCSSADTKAASRLVLFIE